MAGWAQRWMILGWIYEQSDGWMDRWSDAQLVGWMTNG